MTNEMLKKVQNRVTEVQKQLAARGYPLVEIHASVKTLKAGRAGEALPHACAIAISEHYLNEHESQVLYRTVAHEVCHVYVRKYFPRAKQAHGPEFRYLMNSIGVDGSTCHSMQLSTGPAIKRKTKTRYMYVTVNTGKSVVLTTQQHKKALAGVQFTCKGEPIKFTGNTKTWK